MDKDDSKGKQMEYSIDVQQVELRAHPEGSFSSPTLIRKGEGVAPKELLPATWTWAVYSLSFGGLSLAIYCVATVGLVASTGAGYPVLLVALLIDVCLAGMFFVGSAGTLTRDGWGRSMLMVAAAAAVVMLVVDLLMTTTGLGMPPTSAYAGAHSARYAAAFSSAIHACTLFTNPFKIVYCLCLFLHLKSNRVKNTMKP